MVIKFILEREVMTHEQKNREKIKESEAQFKRHCQSLFLQLL
jgi:hypothetical protein